MINLIIYIVSTLLTYILGLLSKKFKWNETLPIPIQNIFVGVITFLVAYICCKVSGTEIDIQSTMEQIIVALGGAGTAALGYDTNKSIKEEK